MRAILFCLVGLVAALPEFALAQAKPSAQDRSERRRDPIFHRHRRLDGRQRRRGVEGNAPGQGGDISRARCLLSRRQDLRPQGPLRGRSRRQRPDAERNHAKHGQQAAGHGQAHTESQRRQFRLPGSDHDRPDRHGSRLNRQFRHQRKGIPGEPDQRRRHCRRAQGFHRRLAGSRRGAGEDRVGAGFFEQPERARTSRCR